MVEVGASGGCSEPEFEEVGGVELTELEGFLSLLQPTAANVSAQEHVSKKLMRNFFIASP